MAVDSALPRKHNPCSGCAQRNEDCMRARLSAVIITLNEARNIERCLKSIDWADEILVADTGSTDQTVDVCKQLGARVIETDWLGFGPTKRWAVEKASYDWILSIDADEEVTPELRERIERILDDANPAVAYRIKRISYYLGKRIRFCGWQRDYPLRLFNRKYGNFNLKTVHESVEFNGTVERIDEPINHYTYPTISDHIRKMNTYTSLAGESTGQARCSLPGALLRALFRFFRMYLLHLGFLDGKVGFLLCLNSAFGIYLKYIKRWEKHLR